MNRSTSFEVRQGVSSSTLPDGSGVLLDANKDECFSLNPVGLMVWTGLERGLTLEAVSDEIVVASGADRERVEGDVDTLAEALLARGLIAVTR